MDFVNEEEIVIPERIINRLNQVKDEAQSILIEATSNQVTTIKQIQFRLRFGWVFFILL